MKKKTLSVWVLAAALLTVVMALAACGGKQEQTDKKSQTSVSAADTVRHDVKNGLLGTLTPYGDKAEAEWIHGSLRTGGEFTAYSKRLVLSYRVKFDEPVKFTIRDGYRMIVYYYSSETTPYKDADRPDGGSSGWKTEKSFTVEAGTYVNICIARTKESGKWTADIQEFTQNVFPTGTRPPRPDPQTFKLVAMADPGRSITDFWKKYLKTKKTDVSQAVASLGDHGDAFVFFTDYHYPVSDYKTYGFSYLPSIINEIGVNKVIFGGDILQQHPKAEAIEILQQFKRDFGGMEIYNIVGNHENNVYADEEDHLTDSDIYEILYRSMGLEDRTEMNPGMYYYFDNKPQKIRYICLNTHTSGAEWRADKAQAEWFIRTLDETPSGYHIVVVTHMYFLLQKGELFTSSIGMSIQKLLDDYVNRQKGKWNGFIYDFSYCQATVACVLTGHTHNDYDVMSDAGYPVIGTMCDAQWGSNQLVERADSATGKIDEHAFDVICIDTKAQTVRAIRIGYGKDRSWSYGTQEKSS